MAQLDENKLHEFVGKMLGDLGGAFSVPTVRIGLRLGLFNALHEGGPATSDELAKRAGGLDCSGICPRVGTRSSSEWLRRLQRDLTEIQSDARTGQMVFLLKRTVRFYLAGAFDIVAAMIRGRTKGRASRSEQVPVCAGVIRQGACSAQLVRSSDRAM